jgi:carboxylesterase type B
MRPISLYNLLFLGGSATLVLSDRNDAPTATIDAGVVVGKTTSLPNALGPVDQFLGVPFAKSPPERFSPAEPAARFSDSLNATEFKPACIQQFRCTCYTKGIERGFY